MFFVVIYAGGQRFKSISLVLSVYFWYTAVGHEQWIETLKGVSMSLVSNGFRRITGYSWNDFVSSQRVRRETETWVVATLVHERQLWHYGTASLGTWQASRMSILLIGLFLYETTVNEGDQGDAQVTHGWGEGIDPGKAAALRLAWIDRLKWSRQVRETTRILGYVPL